MRHALLLLFVMLVAAPSQAQDKVGTSAAQFLGIGIGARSMGMGGAQVATAQGPSALYWNPSAITAMAANAAEFSTMDYLVDTRLQYVGVVLGGGGAGQLGLSITALNYGELEVTTVDNPDGTGELFTPLDLAIGVSYARALTDRFSVGGTIKYVQQRIWNESATGAAVDLGVTYVTGFRGLRIGMSLTNFGTDMKLDGKDLRQVVDTDPNRAGNNDRQGARLETNEWSMPLAFRVGLGINAFQTANQQLTLSVDALAPSDNAQSASMGAEYGFNDLLYLRGGFRQAFASQGDDSGWTLGFGLRRDFGGLGLYGDYVFQQYEPFGTPQTITLGVTF